MPTAFESIGLIAGNRSLPLVFARQARKLGIHRIVAVGFEQETEPALAEVVEAGRGSTAARRGRRSAPAPAAGAGAATRSRPSPLMKRTPKWSGRFRACPTGTMAGAK